MLVLRLQIASIIFEIKIVPTDCPIRVSQSFAAIFKVSRDLFFLLFFKQNWVGRVRATTFQIGMA